MSYCYICSAARSGSTVLDMLLGNHTKIASLGEFSFLGKAISLNQTCSCGEPILECPAWAKIMELIQEEKNTDLRNTPYALWQWDTLASEIVDKKQQTAKYLFERRLRAAWCNVKYDLPSSISKHVPLPFSLQNGSSYTLYLYELILKTWGKKLIVDSSKSFRKAIAIYQKAPQITKVLYLTRDGRGVYFSRRKSGFSKKKSLNSWKNYNQNALRLLKKNIADENMLLVKYEELATNPIKELRRITNFLGICYEENMIKLDSSVRHMVNGNSTMFHPQKGIKLDERWKTELDDYELSYFNKHAAYLNRRLGYL